MSAISKDLALAMRMLTREWHAGELRILIAAVLIAVGSVTAVGFFTDRVEQAMGMQAAELLAADVLMHSSEPIGDDKVAHARKLGLASARTLSFRSVLLVDDAFQLAEVKAVSPGYPLRGRLRIANAPFEINPPETDTIPAPGSVWLDERLMSVLNVEVGDQLDLGARAFDISSVLAYEPDRGGDLFSIAPRLMMHLDDVAATELVQPGSRVTHTVLFAGEAGAIETLRRQLEPLLDGREHFHGVKDARPEMRAALERAEQFLGLAALVSVMLAGAAIAVSSRRYAGRRLDAAAIMRCLGASQGVISRIYAFQVFTLGLIASLLGCVAGYVAQLALVVLFEDLLVGNLPAPSLNPVGIGLMTGILTLAGFALPPILRLKKVPPSRVLRRELGQMPAATWSVMLGPLATLVILILWQAKDLRLAGYVLAGGFVTMAVLALAALVLVKLLRGLRARVGVAFRFGLSNITRRSASSVLQVTAFGVGIMMLLLLTIVRGDVLDEWRANLPPDAPNFFLINIQPQEVDAIESWMTERGLGNIDLYPMVRGRLKAINEHAVVSDDYADDRARRLARREFNLSWTSQLPADNRLVAGNWWGKSQNPAEFSVEEGLAETLGITLGDHLTFDVAGQPVQALVTSLRFVEWDSFKVNFFVVSPPELLSAYPATFISSFYLPSGQRPQLIDLVRRFPSVTVLDVDALLSKVRQIMERAVLGVEYVFAFTLIAGVVVLIAAIESTMDERRYETAIIRTLGGRKKALLGGLLAEFVTLGCLAGLLAALGATLVGAVVAERIFQLSYQPDPRLLLVGLLAGGVGIGVAGVLRARSALEHPPLQVLRSV